MTQFKTPLRYPGGKSRAVSKLKSFLPSLSSYDQYIEPFLGGASVALYVSQQFPHIKIKVNDLYEPLVLFWQQLQTNTEDLHSTLSKLKKENPDHDSAKSLFLSAKDIINDPLYSDLDRAVSFYIVNKCSFSGLTESSSFSPQASDSNFNVRGIDKLPEYGNIIKEWVITQKSYEKILNENTKKKTFIYLDPPYEIKDNLYGKKGSLHRGFSHDKFADICSDSCHDIMVSYNASQIVRDRFKDWRAFEYNHTYTMRSVGDYMYDQDKRKELVLVNYPKISPLGACYNYGALKREGLLSE